VNPFKNSLRPVGVLITLVAGVLQYVFGFVAWADWLGVLGVIPGCGDIPDYLLDRRGRLSDFVFRVDVRRVVWVAPEARLAPKNF
jgi:hypothetical protein